MQLQYLTEHNTDHPFLFSSAPAVKLKEKEVFYCGNILKSQTLQYLVQNSKLM